MAKLLVGLAIALVFLGSPSTAANTVLDKGGKPVVAGKHYDVSLSFGMNSRLGMSTIYSYNECPRYLVSNAEFEGNVQPVRFDPQNATDDNHIKVSSNLTIAFEYLLPPAPPPGSKCGEYTTLWSIRVDEDAMVGVNGDASNPNSLFTLNEFGVPGKYYIFARGKPLFQDTIGAYKYIFGVDGSYSDKVPTVVTITDPYA